MPKHVPDVVTLYPHGPAERDKTPDPPRALPMHVRPGTAEKLAEKLARIAAGEVAGDHDTVDRLARGAIAFARRIALVAGAA